MSAGGHVGRARARAPAGFSRRATFVITGTQVGRARDRTLLPAFRQNAIAHPAAPDAAIRARRAAAQSTPVRRAPRRSKPAISALSGAVLAAQEPRQPLVALAADLRGHISSTLRTRARRIGQGQSRACRKSREPRVGLADAVHYPRVRVARRTGSVLSKCASRSPTSLRAAQRTCRRSRRSRSDVRSWRPHPRCGRAAR